MRRIGWTAAALCLVAMLGPVAPRSPAVDAPSLPSGREASSGEGNSIRAGPIATTGPSGLAPRALPTGLAGRLARTADSTVRAHLERTGIPGAVLAVVADGRVVALREYGVADLATGGPMRADRTRFALGSLSKVVTAVAALRLAEGGALPLDRDVNAFLPRPLVPPSWPEPVTLRDLLTHSGGFEGRSLGIVSRAASGARPLDRYLAETLPRREWPPGRVYVYSQHGYGLVGLTIESVTGTPFPRHVREGVFEPLGMTASRMDPQAPAHPDVATGYRLRDGEWEPMPPPFHQMPPAGGLVAPASDVARLMLALLGGRRDGTGRILRPETLAEMRRRWFAPHPDPRVEGPTPGMFEYRYDGFHVLRARGWTGGHESFLQLFPDRGVGLFVAANAGDSEGLGPLLREEARRLLAGAADSRRTGAPGDPPGVPSAAVPAASLPTASPPTSGGRPRRAPAREADDDPSGRYRGLTYASHGLEALARAFLGRRLEVSRRSDGALTLDFGGARAVARPAAPLLYASEWREGRTEWFAFRRGRGGDVRYLQWGIFSYERVPWHSIRGVLSGLAGLFLLLFGSGVLAGSGRLLDGGDLVRTAGGLRSRDAARRARAAGRLPSAAVVFACALDLVFVGGLVLVVRSGYEELAFGPSTHLRALVALPVVASLLGMAVAGWSVRSRLRTGRDRRRPRRIDRPGSGGERAGGPGWWRVLRRWAFGAGVVGVVLFPVYLLHVGLYAP